MRIVKRAPAAGLEVTKSFIPSCTESILVHLEVTVRNELR